MNYTHPALHKMVQAVLEYHLDSVPAEKLVSVSQNQETATEDTMVHSSNLIILHAATYLEFSNQLDPASADKVMKLRDDRYFPYYNNTFIYDKFFA